MECWRRRRRRICPAGLYLEGMNHDAVRIGGSDPACQKGNFSARTSRLTKKFRSNAMRLYRLPGLPPWQSCPSSMDRVCRIFIPEMVAQGMEQIFPVDGTPKRKICRWLHRWSVSLRSGPGQLLRDVYQVARGLFYGDDHP